MLFKIGVLAIAAFLAWRMVAKAAGSVLGGRGSPGAPGTLEPSRCPRCGVYRLRDRPCNCEDRATR